MKKGKAKLFSFLFPAFLFITIWNILVIGTNSYSTIVEFNQNQTNENLKTQAKLFSQVIENVTDPVTLQRLSEEASQNSQVQFSVITPEGELIADSKVTNLPISIDLKLPEIQEALELGIGSSIREVPEFDQSISYVAHYNPQKLFMVRAGLPLDMIQATTVSYIQRILLSGLVSLAISLLLAYFASKKISTPISKLTLTAQRYAKRELQAFREEQPWEEFESLSDSLSKMARDIDLQITSLTLQKREREAVLASMTEGVIALDQKKRLLSANQAAQDMLQFKSKPLINFQFFNVVISNTLYELVDKTQVSEEQIKEDFHLGTNEESKIIEYRGNKLKDLEGNTIGTLIVLHEVTQLRQFEQMRRDFVANVSHELRTPITSIQGFIETLLEDEMDQDDARHFLQIVDRQTRRLGSIIEDLLYLSRLDQMQDSTSLDKNWYRLSALYSSAGEMCQNLSEAKNIQLQFDTQEHVEINVNIGLFEQALVNLINNAIKYSPENTQVNISLQEVEDGVALFVKDQGPGIAIEHQARLFERFFRIDKARSRAAGGTGLGLAIVKHIARLHDAQAGVKSQVGHGSSFYIQLPHSAVRNLF